MKSSRSVSCSAPLKGDAMAEHCLQALCSWFAKRRKTTESFCHDAGKRPKRRMRVECLEDVRPLLAGTVPPRSLFPLFIFLPASGAEWPRGRERRLLHSPSAHLLARCAAPGSPLRSSQRQRPCFTRSRTQPKNPERHLAHKGASFC